MKLDRVIAVRNNKTVYRDGNRCIKVFNKEYSKSDVLNEALNQARIEETGLNIPKIIEVTMIDGKWAIVSEFIKGKTLAQVMDKVWRMDTTVSNHLTKAKKQGWTQTAEYVYEDGTICGGVFEAPKKAITIRDPNKKRVMSEKQMGNLHKQDTEDEDDED